MQGSASGLRRTILSTNRRYRDTIANYDTTAFDINQINDSNY